MAWWVLSFLAMTGRTPLIFLAVLVLSGCAHGTLSTPQTSFVTVTVPAPQQTQQQSSRTLIGKDGTYVVGVDIDPGTWRTGGQHNCYWARLRSLNTNDIIDNNSSDGPQVVEIAVSDKAFLTKGCGAWTLVSAGMPNDSPSASHPAMKSG
jgi:hypothetical protein